MVRYFNAILFVNLFGTPRNTTFLRHILAIASDYHMKTLELWPSMPHSDATRPRSSGAAAILELGV